VRGIRRTVSKPPSLAGSATSTVWIRVVP